MLCYAIAFIEAISVKHVKADGRGTMMRTFTDRDWGPVLEHRFSGNSELVNSQLKGNSGFLISESLLCLTLSQLL